MFSNCIELYYLHASMKRFTGQLLIEIPVCYTVTVNIPPTGFDIIHYQTFRFCGETLPHILSAGSDFHNAVPGMWYVSNRVHR